MALLGRKSLGIALGSRSMGVAEISAGPGGYRLTRAAEFPFGDSDSLQEPAALGAKLAQFLKAQGFSANSAAFGLPAHWLMLKEKVLPPASAEVLNSMLLIQAERDFTLELADLVLDYVPGRATSDGQGLMLAAALRERIEQVRLLAEAAGLKLQAVTATTLVLAAANGRGDVLYLGPNGAELAGTGSDGLPRLHHIAPGSVIKSRSGPPAEMQLAGELRRALALSHRDGLKEVTLWDDVGVEPSLVAEIAEEMKVPVRPGERFQAAPVEGLAAARAAAAAALALCPLLPKLAPLDFLHSRLAVKPRAKVSSRVIWAALAALALLGGLTWAALEWHRSSEELAELRQTRDEAKENAETAKTFLARLNATRTWYERRPNYLECLRTVTLCFPEEGRIWTSSITLREDQRGILTGRASDEKSVLEVLDRMKSDRALGNVKMLQMRGTGAKSAEVSFGISFLFRGVEGP